MQLVLQSDDSGNAPLEFENPIKVVLIDQLDKVNIIDKVDEYEILERLEDF